MKWPCLWRPPTLSANKICCISLEKKLSCAQILRCLSPVLCLSKLNPLKTAEFGIKGEIVPELPEVETVRRTLEPRLLGRRILAFEALWPKSLAGSKETLENLAQNLKSKRVFSLKRRGKLLLVLLADEAKMSKPQLEKLVNFMENPYPTLEEK